ncbi:MerR family transcriptional regulator [Ihubacter sp. rT4E-8]|uniref:MerR family transcriptional regulator n=1 Tax=unclassified Ihubacter TaxID=2633299 RepID=UPI003C7C9581
MIIKFKEYKIGYLCKLFKITPKAIRLYSEMDLLRPSSKSDSGYRFFHRDDVFTLDYIIRLRKMGFSLKEIRTILHGDDLKDAVKFLDTKLEDLHMQLLQIRIKIAKAEVHQRELQEILSSKKTLEITPPITFLASSIEPSVEEAAERFHRINPYLFPKLTFSFPSAEMESAKGMLPAENRQQVSFILMYEDVENLHMSIDVSAYDVTVLESCRYIHAVTSAEPSVDYHFWDEIKQFMQDHHLNQKGVSFLQYIGTISEHENPRDFYHVYVPVE